ncbi:MAG: hypothetical protein JWN37_949 [Candidatus Nomurabacteria bacterium]|nr:hypothetical protein [Candidatus Nomurabacteria bacterium]
MNRQIRSWVIYDFANSLASIVVAFYFALYFVDTLGLSDVWISLVSVMSTFALLFILPQFGSKADKLGLHKKYLTLTTILTGLSLVCLGLFMSLFSVSNSVGVFLIIIFYFLFQVLYQAAVSFYTSFLKGIAIGKEDKIAGIGNGLGQLGNFIGLAVGFVIVSKAVHLSFLTPISLLFILNAIIFLFIFFFLQKGFIQNTITTNTSYFKLSLTESLKKVWSNKNILYYLIGFLLYSDSILTLNIFISLYLKKVGGLADGAISLLGLVGLMAGVIGAFLMPWIAKKIGSQKKTTITFIILYGILVVIFALCVTFTQFLICLIFAGLLFGLLFSISLSMYTRLIPKNEEGEYYGFYVLFSRFASIIGPPLWSLTAFAFASWGDDRYRFSVIALAILVFVSLFFIRKVKEEYIA